MPTGLNEIKLGGIYYPNIINNDLCAYIQQQYNIHKLFDFPIKQTSGKNGYPLSSWYLNHQKAKDIHTEFLKNKDKFKINTLNIAFMGRISINMFASKFGSIRSPFKNLSKTNLLDEMYLAHYNYLENKSLTFIVPYMTVSHFAFGKQSRELLDKMFL